jgi:fatty-acyl-CoA synthase
MRVEAQIEVAAARELVWQHVTNPADWPRLMAGMTRCVAVPGEPLQGLRARYDVLMQVGSAEVGGEIEIVEFDEPGDMAWVNVTGPSQRGRWRLRELAPDRTAVTLRLSYQAPGGVLGLLADRAAAGAIKDNLKRSLAHVKQALDDETEAETSVLRDVVNGVSRRVHFARVLAQAGVVAPARPDRIVRGLLALSQWGPSPAAGYTSSAILHPDGRAIIDELGTLTFAEVHSLSQAGIEPGDRVAVMCRNHRGFVEATVALSKLGAHSLYLNTSFAGPQLTDVVDREQPVAVIYDEEFADLLKDATRRRKRFLAWSEEGSSREASLEELIVTGDSGDLKPPETPGRAIILTSGTTGAPKGAARKQPANLDPAVSLLSRIPLRVGEPTMVAAPLFHSWGFAHFTLGLLLSTTLVLQRRFDAAATLAAVQEERATVLAAVPVMLQRILELPDQEIDRHDTSSLRVVAVSGSALPGELATRFMDRFGDVVYNLYGSTEVAWATIATPADLRAAPGTAGKPPAGTSLRIADEHDRDVARGETGRIFVGNEMLFDGYTGGGGKARLGGLMATADVGRVDQAGRLFIEGRDDEMIVSGGENVFPREVEDLLDGHESVSEAAVIGVEDQKFGQRLKAFVVTKPGANITADDIKDYVKANLASYKTPRDVEFIAQLPRNATGKVLKRELQQTGVPNDQPLISK